MITSDFPHYMAKQLSGINYLKNRILSLSRSFSLLLLDACFEEEAMLELS